MAWNSDMVYALGIQKIIASIIGIWPVESNDIISKMQVAFIAITQAWMCIDVIKQFIIKGHCGSILELVDIISTHIPAFIIVIKMIVTTIYRDNFHVIITSAINDWSEVIDQKSRLIMLRYARIGRIIVIVQIFGVFTISCQVIFDRLRITMDVWNEQTNSSAQISGFPLWPMCWIPIDILAIHLCGQHQVLNTNLKYFDKIEDPNQYKYHLRQFIKRHDNLIMLTDTFEETYNLNILAEVGMNIILICISGIVLLIGLQSSDIDIVAAMIIRIFMLNCGIFLHSYIGEQLNRESANLHMTIYSIPWYNMPPNMMKDITVIMLRCNICTHLTMEVKTTYGEELSWNSNTNYALGLYKTLGRALGIWPLKYFDIFSYIRVAFIAIIQLWMSIDLTQQLLIKGNCGDVTELVDVLSLITCGILTATKVIILKIYEHNVYVIVNSAVEDWTKVMDKKSRRIMFKYAKIGRTVFIIQMIGAYAAGFPLIFARLPFITALWDDRTNTNMIIRQVPIGPSCWISPDLSAYNYAICYIVQSIQLFIVCTGYIGSDTYFFGIAMHVCGQFELLHMRIENLDKIKDNVSQRREIIKFSKRHKHLLTLADNFEQTFNIIILAQVGADTILICISGIVLLISLQSPNFIIISGLVIRIYLVYVQLFMYSYVGEKLSEQAQKLQVAFYNCSWYYMAPNLAMGSYFSILRLMFIDQS
ncbi:hypothetical protein PV325_012901 [Microctonus aethiopoides]|nr:hypothetical protein PV325_012901 [Microctonus aethiopoides]